MGMVDRHNRDLVVVDPINDRIGKSSYQRQSQVLEDLTVERRHPPDEIKGLLDAKEEIIA